MPLSLQQTMRVSEGQDSFQEEDKEPRKRHGTPEPQLHVAKCRLRTQCSGLSCSTELPTEAQLSIAKKDKVSSRCPAGDPQWREDSNCEVGDQCPRAGPVTYRHTPADEKPQGWLGMGVSSGLITEFSLLGRPREIPSQQSPQPVPWLPLDWPQHHRLLVQGQHSHCTTKETQ